MLTALYSISCVLAVFGTLGCVLLHRLCIAVEIFNDGFDARSARLCNGVESVATDARKISGGVGAVTDLLQRHAHASFEELGSLGSLGNS